MAAPAAAPVAAVVDNSDSYVTPLVRRLAAQNGVDLSTITGSGVGGRIRKQDVLAAAAPKAAAPAAAAPSALPAGTATIRPGSRIEYGVVEGRKGAQALSVRIIEVPTLSATNRKPAEDLAIITEDLIRLLDQLGGDLKRGKYPAQQHGRKVAALLRKVADELDV